MKRSLALAAFLAFMLGMLIFTGDLSAKNTGINETNGKKMKNSDTWWIYIGNTTGKPTDAMVDNNVARSEGIYVGKFNSQTGAISDIRLALKVVTSNFFTQDSEKGILYASGQLKKEDKPSVMAFKMDPKTGDLTFINSQPTTGQGVCHVAISPDHKFLTAANYSSGDFSVFKLNSDGSIGEMNGFVKKNGGGPDPRRQKAAFGHASYFFDHKGVSRMLMVDLGSDKVYVQRLDKESGKVFDDPEIPVLSTPAGAGPRHLTWAVNKKGNPVIFVLNELASNLSVFELKFKSEGAEKSEAVCLGTWTTLPSKWSEKLTDEVTLVDGEKYLHGSKTAEIELICGKAPFLYCSNRGHNSLAIFNVRKILDAEANAVPELIDLQPTFGNFPRFFHSDPTGKFMIVCNKKTGTVIVFTIDKETGKLMPINQEPTRIAWPLSLGFIPVAE